MKHAVLFGDSIFDNEAYVAENETVIDFLAESIAQEDRVSLQAVDGGVTLDVPEQLEQFSGKASHLFVSCGGNDALGQIDILSQQVSTVEEALYILETLRNTFREDYRTMLEALQQIRAERYVCTIYNKTPGLCSVERAAVALFNEVILEEASRYGVNVVDLRVICNEREDYSEVSAIEPSAQGAKKIADVIRGIMYKARTVHDVSIFCGDRGDRFFS